MIRLSHIKAVAVLDWNIRSPRRVQRRFFGSTFAWRGPRAGTPGRDRL